MGTQELVTPPGVTRSPEPSASQQPTTTPTLQLGVIATGAAVLLLRIGLRAVSDPDAWLHLRLGEYLRGGGRFVLPDPWSPSATTAYVPTQWLPEILGSWVYDWAGLPGIAMMRFVGVLALLAVLYAVGRARSDALPAAVAAALALAGTAGSLVERPQLISFIFLALTVLAWGATLRDGRPRWWLVGLTWIWVCCHGLWVVGLGYGVLACTALVIADRGLRREHARPMAVVALSAIASCLTPLGLSGPLAPFRVTSAVSSYVSEWQPSTVHDLNLVFVLVTVAVVVGLWLRRGTRPSPIDVMVLCCGLVAALWMGRLIAVGAILLTPIVAEALQSLLRRQTMRPARREHIVLTGVGAVTLAVAALVTPSIAKTASDVPLGLTQSINRVPAGQVVFVDQRQSGWLMWERPDLKTSLDLRTEIFSRTDIRGYIRATAVRPGWEAAVAHTGATYALLRTDSPLGLALSERAKWTLIATADEYGLWKAP